MMHKTILAAILAGTAASASAAFATNAITVQPGPVNAPPPPQFNENTPRSAGKPHSCSSFYPATAVALRQEGTTMLGFNVTSQGTVADVVVLQSSGNTELDQAAASCVQTWIYKPAMQNGEPVQAAWKAKVLWALPKLAYAQTPRDCLQYYGVNEDEKPNIGFTVVTFHITGGAVSNVALVRSSGNATLDQEAMACAATWSFEATYPDGTPTDKQQNEIVWWVSPHLF